MEMSRERTYAPMTVTRLLAVYLTIWLVCGLAALVLHLVFAPDYINVPTRVIGGLANLFGPWARPMVASWPNGGKPPHAPSAFMGAIALVFIGVVVLASLTASERRLQYLWIALFVPLVAFWIGVGVLELMVCAA